MQLSPEIIAQTWGRSFEAKAHSARTGVAACIWRLRARALLETSDLSVTDIAAAIGYDDLGQLSTAFRRRFGVTPPIAESNDHERTNRPCGV